jgi:hypothetical protein
VAGDAGEDHLDAALAAFLDHPGVVRNYDIAHALVERLPAGGLLRRILVFEISRLDVDHQERRRFGIENDIVRLLGRGVVE